MPTRDQFATLSPASGFDANARRDGRPELVELPVCSPEADNCCAMAWPRQPVASRRADYAATARRFLEVSRRYLAFQYTGSRHWYPHGGIFSAPSAGSRRHSCPLEQGDKHAA
jgi:hypothetical protein